MFIRRSKTDQLGKGAWISLFLLHKSLICPIKALNYYFSIHPIHFGSLFILQDGSVLTRYQFNLVLKKSLVALNLDKFRITSHSFCIGAATEAARLGLNSELIRKIRRWEPGRFQLYVRPNLVIT